MKASRWIHCVLGVVCLAVAIAISILSIPMGYDDVCHDDYDLPISAWVWDDMSIPAFSPTMPKIIALTFDDGPHCIYTAQLLDFLKDQNVKATFFVLGYRAKYNRSLIKRMNDEGHQIGNHGYDHESFTILSNSALRKQISETNDIIKDITGKAPSLVRPPRGKINSGVKAVVNMPLIFWSVDPRDWATRDADKVFAYVVKRAKPGDIVLLHDIRQHTVKAVKKIVPALKEKGFTFVTVEDLLISVYGELDGNLDRSAN